MSQNVSITDLEEQDRETVRQLLIDSYSQYEKKFENPDMWLNYLANISASVDNPQIDRILVAKNGQSVLGTLQLFESSEKAYGRPELEIFSPIVRLLAVHPEARGRGVGQALLKESCQYAKLKRAESLYLHSTDLMQKAIQLYEWLGFKRDESKEFYNQNILVKCYRFDLIKEEGEFHEPNRTRSPFNFNPPPYAPISRAVKRGV
ncbi:MULTISPECIES: GNAT family N-acetyltransferase [Bacillus]|uniref:GNAT superfamily N-acetyltransferase n=1 Tax=Bacillus capparidis TaxID=1840411 RepID=A0ABS4D1Z2_9BACI|nr:MULTISPECIES: GNAT family N-acetyltransferase [Bacillus]MBP1083631.1 GNAT superfamily N-acetyltransferase [Bacillus capparidis]MED1094824.1 GNAT family N-acetyltransferase [Bacillus capparidis]